MRIGAIDISELGEEYPGLPNLLRQLAEVKVIEDTEQESNFEHLIRERFPSIGYLTDSSRNYMTGEAEVFFHVDGSWYHAGSYSVPKISEF